VPKSFGHTTAPESASTVQEGDSPESLALVIVGSTKEPHRMGQVAHFRKGESLLLGRGYETAKEKYARFRHQRPGQTPAVDPRDAFLDGDSISRRQALFLATDEGLEMTQVGSCRTFVNGVERRAATLQPGHTVMLKGELVVLCVRWPTTLVLPRGMRELPPYGQPDDYGMVGEGPDAWILRDQLAAAARGRGNVRIHGESGTGKELAAAAIHKQSSRAGGPFVARNASTFTASLLASELFGNAVNYPNHGMAARKGLFGAADHGIAFLDEIGELPLDLQPQFLRVLDHGELQVLGEASTRRVDVRVVAATNRDDSFLRADLLARFLLRVRVPPLRERPEDIMLIARHLLVQHARQSPDVAERFFWTGPDGQLQPRLSMRLVDYLVRHPLPTNVRELERILLDAVETSHGGKLRIPATGAPSTKPRTASADESEPAEDGGKPGVRTREEVMAALARAGGNVARAARFLGIHRKALYRLMEKYGIESERKD
jgi:DNA-binding NtrC family response regulator